MVNYFIVNPNAGAKKAKLYKAIIQLIKSDSSHIVWETNKPIEAITLTQNAIQQGATKIIAVGGDGTINEVASALTGTTIPLGIIPIGSGNGLARHLGIPLSPIKAFNFALNTPFQKMDVGSINGKYFFCTAGIGFDAAVAHCFAMGSSRGFLNYVKSTLLTLLHFKPIQIAINDGPFETIFSLTIANANQFGNNAIISPFSNVQDGLLELIKIKKINYFQAASIAIRLFLGNIHASKNVNIASYHHIKIRCNNNSMLHMDGENVYTSNELLTIQILPGALYIIA